MPDEACEWEALTATSEILPGYWRAWASTEGAAQAMIAASMQRRSEFVLLRKWRNEGAKVREVKEKI